MGSALIGAVSFFVFDRPEKSFGANFSNLEVRPLGANEHVIGSAREEADTVLG